MGPKAEKCIHSYLWFTIKLEDIWGNLRKNYENYVVFSSKKVKFVAKLDHRTYTNFTDVHSMRRLHRHTQTSRTCTACCGLFLTHLGHRTSSFSLEAVQGRGQSARKARGEQEGPGTWSWPSPSSCDRWSVSPLSSLGDRAAKAEVRNKVRRWWGSSLEICEPGRGVQGWSRVGELHW